MTLNIKDTLKGSVTGNAGTATTLQTARAINGTSFNGSADITTANWGTARTLTIGNKGQSVNGSGNVTWSLADIGAAAASHGTHVTFGGNGSATTVSRSDHTHSYLPLSGGTLTGNVGVNSNGKTITMGTGGADVFITNSASGKYLQLKDNGVLGYSDDVILHSANFGSYAVPLSGGTMSGRLTANGGITVQCPGGSWITGKNNLANLPITSSTQISEAAYHPMIGAKLFNGDVVNIGGLGNTFGFYGYAASRTDNGIDWQFSFDSGNRAAFTNLHFSCDGDITTNKYVNINAWPGYGSGTASFWYNGNSGNVHCNAGILTDKAFDAGWHCNFRDGFSIPSRGNDRRGALFNVYGSGSNSYLEIVRRNSADTDWDWGNSIKLYPDVFKATRMDITGGGGCFKLYSGNQGHTWMAFHVQDGSRGAWMGYGSQGSTAFTIHADGGNGRVHIQSPTFDGTPFTISSYAPSCGGVWVQI